RPGRNPPELPASLEPLRSPRRSPTQDVHIPHPGLIHELHLPDSGSGAVVISPGRHIGAHGDPDPRGQRVLQALPVPGPGAKGTFAHPLRDTIVDEELLTAANGDGWYIPA